MTTQTTKTTHPQPSAAWHFIQTYRVQIGIISLLVLLYVVFIIGDPRT